MLSQNRKKDYGLHLKIGLMLYHREYHSIRKLYLSQESNLYSFCLTVDILGSYPQGLVPVLGGFFTVCWNNFRITGILSPELSQGLESWIRHLPLKFLFWMFWRNSLRLEGFHSLDQAFSTSQDIAHHMIGLLISFYISSSMIFKPLILDSLAPHM